MPANLSADTESQTASRFPTIEKDAAVIETVNLLLDSLSPGGVADWFAAKNRYLGGERPIDLLSANQHDRVLEAARAFIEGTYL